MMVGTSISNEVDGIRAPTTWSMHLVHHRVAANWSFVDRIALRVTVKCKLIACDADPRHTFLGWEDLIRGIPVGMIEGIRVKKNGNTK
jgi:hypothetical protein